MKYIITLLFMTLIVSSCGNDKKPEEVKITDFPVDKQATTETQALYAKMKERMGKGIMFGHQDDLAYGHTWYNEPNRSDVHDVCGDYPALIGWELGHLELGNSYNLDSVYFINMKRYVKEAHQRGSINTFSWHGDNIVTGNTAWDCKQDSVVSTVLPGGSNHKKYLIWLDRLADFFSELTDESGTPIPVVFRMYHEHTGNWFWWGAAQCSPDEYKQLWKMTVEYLRNTRKVHNILYAYSPSEVDDEAAFLARYPGDEYVDIVGFDCYVPGKDEQAIEHYKKRMDLNLGIVTAYAAKADKIPIVGETGMEGVTDPEYFTQVLFTLISKYKISSVLLWRNARQSDRPDHYYVPFSGHPACDDFIQFVEKPEILMCKDLYSIGN